MEQIKNSRKDKKIILLMHKIALFSFLRIFASCNGQQQPTKLKNPYISSSGPAIIKNFKSAFVAPDFDTTLVSQYIRSIFQDSEGNLWFGTIGEG